MNGDIVSLCSGIDGLDAGLIEATGARVAVRVECDEATSGVLAHRFPGVPLLSDVRDPWALIDYAGAQWLTAGYPCQPFSDAGKRLGAADPRHLWPWVRDAIRVVQPRYVLLENVRGHVKRGLPEVLADLVALGYGGVWGIFRASDVGAPHQRARVFVLAMRQDRSGPGQGFSEVKAPQAARSASSAVPPTAQLASNGRGQHPDKRKAGGHGPTLADEVGHLLPTPAARDGKGVDARSPVRIGADATTDTDRALPGVIVDLLPTPRASDCFGAGPHGDGGLDLRTAVTLLPTPTTSNANGNHVNGRGEVLLPGAVALLPTPRATDGTHGGPVGRGRRGDLMMPSVVHAQDWDRYASAIERWERITGRSAPAPTEPGMRSARVLAVRFVEWMMGYPDGYLTDLPPLEIAAARLGGRVPRQRKPPGGAASVESVAKPLARNAMLRMLGNAVVPQQAAYAVGILTCALRGIIDASMIRQVECVS